MKKIMIFLIFLSFFSCHAAMQIKPDSPKSQMVMTDEDIALFMAYNAAMMAGDINAAEKYVYEFIQRFPDYNEAIIDLTNIYTFTKRYDNAFETVNLILKKDPDNLEALMALANIHILKGDKKGAFPVLEKIVSLDAIKENYYIFLANIYVENKRFEDAKRVLLKLLKKFPNSFFGRVGLAKVYEELNMNEEAAKEYELAFSQREEDEILINLDNIYDKLGDRKKSIEVLEKFIQRNPDFPKVRERLARLYLGENNYDKALENLDIIISQFPDNPDILSTAAFIALDGEKVDRAGFYVERLLEKAPNSDRTRYIAGLYYKELKDWDKVVIYFKDIRDEEYYKSAMINLSVAYEKLKKYDEAYNILKELWDKEKDPDAGYFLALYLKNKKKYNDALSLLDDLLNKGEKRGNRVIFLKGEILIKINRFNEGVNLVESWLKDNPDDPDALNFVGYSYIEKGMELEKSYGYIKRALELKPDDPYITDSLAWYYYMVGRYDKAYEIIMKAHEKIKDDPTILEHIGDILVKLKRYREAKNFYQESLKHNPEDPDAVKRKIEELKNY